MLKHIITVVFIFFSVFSFARSNLIELDVGYTVKPEQEIEGYHQYLHKEIQTKQCAFKEIFAEGDYYYDLIYVNENHNIEDKRSKESCMRICLLLNDYKNYLNEGNSTDLERNINKDIYWGCEGQFLRSAGYID